MLNENQAGDICGRKHLNLSRLLFLDQGHGGTVAAGAQEVIPDKKTQINRMRATGK